MIKIGTQTYKKQDLLQYFGDYSCVAGIRQYILAEGKSNGCEIIEVNLGNGIVFEINKSRGLDIGRCTYRQIPISYQSYNREVNPLYYEPFCDGWLRNFAGGLLVTCGLTSMGSPQIDHGEILPLHGRISNIPAERVNINEFWEKDELYFEISGKVKESKALHHHLQLRRTISAKAGSPVILIHDQIENLGFEDIETMILYHFNIGHPILSEEAQLYVHSSKVTPRDHHAQIQKEAYNQYRNPQKGYGDVVYYHDLQTKGDYVHVALINEKIHMGIALRYRKSQLDCFTQWKFTDAGNYVAGIEPGNAYVNGRKEEREAGRLKIIKAQEVKDVEVMVRILTTMDEITKYKKENDF